MKITKTGFDGLWVLEPVVLEDEQRLFFESYNKKTFDAAGIKMEFVQDNQSWSRAGVIRGLHFQIPPLGQTKLVRVLQGEIWDVAVDLRSDQPTYKKVFYVELSAKNKKQLLVPQGFAHGFSVLSDGAEVLYKSDRFYTPGMERGILYDDPELKIDWKGAGTAPIVSKKDKAWPRLSEIPVYFR